MAHILVAEDSFALANLLEFVLKRAGFKTTLARNGDIASMILSSEQFDLLVLDQQMPGKTGIDLLREVRSGGPNQATPAFLCTAKTNELNLPMLQKQLSIAGVFQKPFSPRELVDALQAVTHAAPCS